MNLLYRSALERVVDSIDVNGKAFLITGASGLIGSCLIDLLMIANEKGKTNHVYALGRSAKKLESRFTNYLSSNTFHVVEQDICFPISDNLHFDYIVHAASNAELRHSELVPRRFKQFCGIRNTERKYWLLW